PLPHLREVAPYLSHEVADVVMAALERDRDRRISTCAEFADRLEKAAMLSGELGSPRDVQSYMDRVLGEDLRSQREAVRQWTALADSKVGPITQLVTPTGGQSTPGLETLGSPDLTGASKPKRGLGLLAVILLVGVGGFLGYRTLKERDAASISEPRTVDVDATAPPSPTANGSKVEPEPTDTGVLPLADVDDDTAVEAPEKETPPTVAPRQPKAPRPAPSTSPTPSPSPEPSP